LSKLFVKQGAFHSKPGEGNWN